MKKLILVGLALIFFCFVDMHAQYSIGDPISITNNDDSFGYRSPKLAADANGDLLLFWMRTGSNEAFYFARNEGAGFSAPIEISLNGMNPNLWSGSLGPNMAAGGGHIYVTFEIYGDAIYIIHSSDGGLNWETPVAAYIPEVGRRATIPSVAVDNDGQPYVIYVNTNAAEEDAHYGLVRSADFGATFSNEVIVNDQTAGNEVCECCNGHVDVAPNGDVYVAYRNNNNSLRDNWLAKSVDGGDSFTSHYDMDQSDWTANVCPSNGPHFLIQEERVVSTFFTAASGWDNGSYFSSVDLNSEMISNTIQVPLGEASSVAQNRPKIAGVGDTLAIVFQENFNGSTDIAMSFSTTGLSGLASNSVHLTNAPNTQQYPSIVYANGSFHVVYEDLVSNTVLYQEISLWPNSIGELNERQFSIYPNPVDDILKVKGLYIGEAKEVHIVDMNGRKVRAIENIMDEINVSDLKNGSYVISFLLDGKIISNKIQILHRE